MAAPSGATPVLGLRYPIQDDPVDVPRDVQALAEDVEARASFLIGEIKWLGFVNPGPMWLPCDGTTRAQAAYPELFAKIQHLWDTGGEAPTDFRLPGLNGRSPVGPGTPTGGNVEGSPPNRVVATKWGVNAVMLTDSRQNASHGHTVGDPGHFHVPSGGGAYLVTRYAAGLGPDAGAQPSWYPDVIATDSGVASSQISIVANGGGMAHDNTQPSIAVPVFIYAGRV